MTLRHLRIFVAVCEEGSITNAGRKLYLAQPTVSLVITELERHYNARLFDRIAKRLYITEAGRQLLQYAQHITALFDEMEENAQQWDENAPLRVGASITIGNCLLPGLMRTYQAERPQAQAQVHIDNSDQIERGVLENRMDIGLIEGVSHSAHVHSEAFYDDALALICAADDAWSGRQSVKPEELVEKQFIMREQGSGSREVLEGILLLHNIAIHPLWESTSTQAIVRAVGQGLGVAVLPLLLVQQDIAEGTIRRVALEGVSLERKFYIIHHKNKYLTASARHFMGLCHAAGY